MRHTLERHKAFPVVAWIAIIGLAGLVWMLAGVLRNEAGALETDRTYTEQAIEQDLRYGKIEY